MSNNEEKVVQFPVNEEVADEAVEREELETPMSDEELAAHVTRGELIEIMTQMVENVNQIGDYLMQDVNTMYSQHLFPFQIRMAVMEELLIEKGIVTSEEINKHVEDRIKALQEQAKEIKAKEEASEE